MINTLRLSLKFEALAVSLIVAVALPFALRHYMQLGQVVITTRASQWHHTTLADGTAVHVDARSQVKVEYSDEARIVTVDQGSAVFEVAHDPKRPFIARTHLLDATAVGTRFGVSIDRGVTTTVSEGIVAVTARGQYGTGAGIILKAGEELRVPESGQGGPTHAKVNAERRLEWATGWLAFEGETVGDIVNELNRRNAIQIEIEQPDVSARPMHGYQRFRVDSSAAIAQYIAETNDLVMIEDRSGSVLRLRPTRDRAH